MITCVFVCLSEDSLHVFFLEESKSACLCCVGPLPREVKQTQNSSSFYGIEKPCPHLQQCSSTSSR